MGESRVSLATDLHDMGLQVLVSFQSLSGVEDAGIACFEAGCGRCVGSIRHSRSPIWPRTSPTWSAMVPRPQRVWTATSRPWLVHKLDVASHQVTLVARWSPHMELEDGGHSRQGQGRRHAKECVCESLCRQF